MSEPIEYGWTRESLMRDPLAYQPGFCVPDEIRCFTCSKELGRYTRAVDHCHTHGWVRGVLCKGCNYAMHHIDKGECLVSRITQVKQLCDYAGNCRDCPPRNPADIVLAVHLRLTQEQHAAIKAYAEREGRSLNNAIAHAVDGLTGRTA